MERGKIVITRLRNSEYYKGERLNHIVDSIYHLCNNYIEKNPLYPNLYDSYNVSLLEIEKNRKNIRDINSIEQSNVLIIPTESEFAYHIYGRISNIMLGRGWTMVQNIREVLLRNPKPRVEFSDAKVQFPIFDLQTISFKEKLKLQSALGSVTVSTS